MKAKSSVFIPGSGPDLSLWPQVLSHSHHLRGKGMNLADTNTCLVKWCSERNIRAFGIGSPWEPAGAAACVRCETTLREAYDAGQIDLASVKHEEEVHGMLTDLNRLSNGDTLFYLDNETPKARYGHLWWFNWHFDVPAWHDYSQDRPIQYYRQDPDTEHNPLANRPFRRRPYLEILRTQRAHGALGVWAHPTSWWRHHGEFVTNIAAESGLHMLSQGRLDGLVVMGYDVYQSSYQNLWFNWLDHGGILPAFAESDQSNNSLNRPGRHDAMFTRLYTPETLSLSSITDTARQGRACVTTGGLLNLHTHRTPMGGVHTLKAGEEVELLLDVAPPPGQETFSCIQFIGKGGKIIAQHDQVSAGTIHLRLTADDQPGYVVTRGFGEEDSPHKTSPDQVKHLTLSNPVYLHPPGFKFETVRTALHLSATSGGRYQGQNFCLRSFTGEILEESSLDVPRNFDIPADAFLEFPGLDDPWPLYPCMENQAVQDLLAYLWKGDFLRDFPGCGPGQVPPEAWRLTELRNALSQQKLVL